MKRKLTKKHRVLVFVLLLFIGFSVASPFMSRTEAIGIPVIDVSAIIQMIQQLVKLEAQIQLMQENLKHLQSLGGISSGDLLGTLSSLYSIRQSARGLTFEYGKTQTAWDNTYKKYEDFNGMSATECADYLQTIDQQTANALNDAMNSQGLISEIDTDKSKIGTVLSESNRAAGSLAVVQATNKMLALEIAQLMRMQTIMAMSYRAQTLYLQWEMQEKMSQRNNLKRNKVETANPTLNLTGTTFIQFR